MKLRFHKRADRRLKSRVKNKVRIRKKVFGTMENPRLSVFKSTRHMYAQLVVDTNATTLVSASTLEKEAPVKSSGSIEGAQWVGQEIGRRAREKNIKKVVFDRGGYVYHGRVKALADGARESGLDF